MHHSCHLCPRVLFINYNTVDTIQDGDGKFYFQDGGSKLVLAIELNQFR